MNTHTLKTVLVDELGAEDGDDGYEIPAHRKVTVLVRFGEETLRVTKVSTIRFTDHFVNLVGETEQFFVDGDSEFAVKSEDSKKRSEARPGFH